MAYTPTKAVYLLDYVTITIDNPVEGHYDWTVDFQNITIAGDTTNKIDAVEAACEHAAHYVRPTVEEIRTWIHDIDSEVTSKYA